MSKSRRVFKGDKLQSRANSSIKRQGKQSFKRTERDFDRNLTRNWEDLEELDG